MLLFALAACSPDDTPAAAEEGPSWATEVAPIVEARCSSCHQPGGASFDLTDPAAASAMATAMADAVTSRRMPPWGAFETETCAPTRGWADDRRLDDAEIATIAAWAEAGAPVDEAVPASPAPPPGLSGDLTELVAGAYTTRGGEDEFVCLAIDPGNTEDLWIDALEVVPSNDAIAHHTLVYVDEAATSDGLVNEDGWYDCSTGTGFNGATFLATWVPGSGPTYAPAGTGMRIPAGSRIVMQMHYHPGGATDETDQTTVRLRTLDQEPDKELHNTLIGNAWNEASGLQPGPNDDGRVEFRIPANVAGHTEEMRAPLDGRFPNLPIPSIGAHMHLIGTSMEVWIERAEPDEGEPERECLLPASRYDYDWQQLYYYEGGLEDAPMVSGGDTLVLKCTYDNTLANPGTARALEAAGLEEPVDVYLGEGTLDEMCIGLFSYVY